MKILFQTLLVCLLGFHSAAAKLPANRIDYLQVTYAGMKNGAAYLQITNISKKTISYVSDGDTKNPIFYTDVWKRGAWNVDRGLRCATGRSVAELSAGESHIFLAPSWSGTGDKLRVRLVCRSGSKAEWSGLTKSEKFVSRTLLVTKKIVDQDTTPHSVNRPAGESDRE